METVELKRCPFCNGEAVFGTKRDGEWYQEWYAIACLDCGAEIEDSRKFMCDRLDKNYDEEKIIEHELSEKWNRRTDDERNNE